MTTADILVEYDHEMANTRRTLANIRDETLGFRPHERSWTLAELATHIANVPNWLLLTLSAPELDLAADLERPAVPVDTRELLERFDLGVAAGRKALAVTDEETLAEPWTLRNGDHVLFTLPRTAVIRTTLLNHMIHHRGQLTVYLRLTGAPVPSLYGPSADEG
ncbi:MAG TPA: DinB family protein [Longimicrobiales bacterium]|nr:DinB family protein [Longimicrobiales bacterium]